jgi:hypothetical protein
MMVSFSEMLGFYHFIVGWVYFSCYNFFHSVKSTLILKCIRIYKYTELNTPLTIDVNSDGKVKILTRPSTLEGHGKRSTANQLAALRRHLSLESRRYEQDASRV